MPNFRNKTAIYFKNISRPIFIFMTKFERTCQAAFVKLKIITGNKSGICIKRTKICINELRRSDILYRQQVRWDSFHFLIIFRYFFLKFRTLRQRMHIRLLLTETKNMFGMRTTESSVLYTVQGTNNILYKQYSNI
jgi:hypothetical protein